MKINYYHFLLSLSLTLLTCLQPLQGQSALPNSTGHGLGAKAKIKWTANPFDHQVFIENGGQFTGPANADKILYGAQVGDLYVFITPHGLIYKYTEHPEMRMGTSKKLPQQADPDDIDWKKMKPADHYVTATWEGSNGATNVVAGQERPDYYTYPAADGKSTIKVNIFRTVTCQNIYPGIDVEYSFIPGKDGFEYALIVHPGANLANIKLKYNGTKKMYLDKQGNIQISSGWGTFTDHAPVSFPEGDSAGQLASGYRLQDNVESFHVSNPDPFRTLVIDPWATNWTTAYAGIGMYTGAYDLDYDYAGNVYIYGAYGPFQLAKYNSAGVQIWTYNTSNFPYSYFGCFCVDKFTGNSFCFEGFGGGSYAYTDKVNTNGVLVNQLTSGTLDEQWRAAYDLCSHEIAIAGGGISQSLQAATLDTANSTYTSVNVMGLSPSHGYHDLCLVACDPLVDTTYMASTWTYANKSLFNNTLMRLPMPTLSPTGLSTYDGLNFQECASPRYVATGPGNTNGMNGMAISPNWLYTYDGDSLQQIDKNTGAINAKINVSNTYFLWGGIAVDLCDNIYLGNGDSVDIYNGVTMSYTGSIGAFTGNVYDVVLGNGVLGGHDSILYVCGKGFVSSIEIDPPSPPIIKKSKKFYCSCKCTATGLLSFCGNVDTSADASYLWSNGQTTYTATGLCPGNSYTLTVSLGCAQQYTDTFNMPLTDTFHMTFATIDPTCGLCNGSATVTASGGGTPYTYLWTPSLQTTKTATGLCVGTYTVSVTDSCGDVTTAPVTINTTGLTISTTVTNDKCNGNCNGTASAVITGGSSPYTYAWTPSGGKSATATGLCAGTYTLTVKDVNGCEGTTTAVITQPAPITATKTITNVLCNGGTGSATVTPAGGTSPYTYFWNPSAQTTATATGLKAGTYTVTITDVNNCTETIAVALTQPPTLTASIATPAYPPCNGGVGSATASGGGGTSPYTYSWTPTAQTTATATGLSAATYSVTVKDVNGCSASASVVITQPTVVKAAIAVTYPACNGNKGSATVTASGGTPGYKYVWNPSGQTTATATGLGIATYTATVTDAHGCTGTASISITQPAVLTVTTTFSQATCNLANGSATATPAGGTSPYAYSWAPGGQTNATATGIKAATYTVTVKDNNGCTVSTSVTVTQPSAVVATITSVKNATCFGTASGSATVSASGGTAPYGYQWSPAGGNGATGTGLTAGNYTVTVRDNNGCTTTATTVITQPAAIVVTVTGAPIRCLGNSAVYTANITGGTGPYNYTWNPGSQNGSSVTLTPTGSMTYTVTVTDANGCQQNGYVSFTFPPPLAVSINGASVTCSKRTATLCALATGGTGGDIYLWEPVNSASPCVTIPASITTVYTVTVSDNCGVSATASTTVHVQPPPEASFLSSSTQGCAPMCVQFHNTTPPTGGKEMYEWNFGNGDSLQEENPIYCYPKAGSYNVTLTVVSDSGCSSSLRKANFITVYGKPKAAFTYSPQPVTILTPTVQFTDESEDTYGVAYRWWNFGDNSDSTSHLANPVHTYQDTGSYCATLVEMNEKGCSDTVTNCLVVEPLYNLYIPSAFTPNGDGINDVFVPVGQYIRDFDMYIFDRWGMEIYHTTDITKGWDGTVHGNGTVSQEDTYIYKITVTDAQYHQHSYIGNVTLLK